ncbi:helix-turn-helix domain-containing protein [Paraglaciecola sp.]|uniref:helix-turn-helix domain-containing protein n=1 Tax=Paraglaciecola sp. TaxID=1920173 RepID=UPI0030F42F5D
MLDWVGKIAFSDSSSALQSQGQENKFGFRRLAPKVMTHSHWHAHIEINYLFNCSADYLINGKKISVPEGRMLLFWATFPHQMIETQGEGELVNVYVPLQSFLTWKLPDDFVSNVLNGDVIVSNSLYKCDEQLTRIWESDINKNDYTLTVQVINEIRGRIRRMTLEDYSTFDFINRSTKEGSKPLVKGMFHIQTMLRYIADNYAKKITIEDVSNSTGLHKNYAMKLFNREMRLSIKQYINQLRLQHAQALLIDTENPVLNIALEAGFGSVSRFYDIFQREFQMSPLEFRRSVI